VLKLFLLRGVFDELGILNRESELPRDRRQQLPVFSGVRQIAHSFPDRYDTNQLVFGRHRHQQRGLQHRERGTLYLGVDTPALRVQRRKPRPRAFKLDQARGRRLAEPPAQVSLARQLQTGRVGAIGVFGEAGNYYAAVITGGVMAQEDRYAPNVDTLL